jgi:hypothetical protein
MMNIRCVYMLLLAWATAGAMAFASTPPIAVTVDCNQGQSLNQTLAKLDKQTPTTVSVSGTCTEYVSVVGFENLSLNGMTGATLAQPSGGGTLFTALLLIESSRSVIVNGFNVQADSTINAIGIGHGSTDIRLRHLNITGGGEGIIIFENSQVSIAYVIGQAPGYTTLGIYDSSDVHLEHSQFTATPGAGWNVGIAMGASHVTMYDTVISDMQVGIGAYQGSIVDINVFNTYYSNGGPTDVKILNPAGTSFNGVQVDGGGSLNLNSARLLIHRAGQTWAGTTGGVLLSNGATLNGANGNLQLIASNGQGLVAQNNSHATLNGVTISGSAHGGIVATNLSTVDMASGTTLSTVSGNSVDLFCDSSSWVTGTANIFGKPTSQCTNQLTSETVTLP